MRKRTAFVTLAVVMAMVGQASPAGAIGGFVQWQDSGDANSGYGFGLKHKFQIVPIVAVEARASWLSYDVSGGSQDMVPLEAAGRANLGILYGGGGLGYYIFTNGDLPLKDSVGSFLMAGGEFGLLGLGAFAELRYLFLAPDRETGSGKVDMDGFGANVGVSISF